MKNNNNKKKNLLPPKMENSVPCQKVMEKMHLKHVFTCLKFKFILFKQLLGNSIQNRKLRYSEKKQ